MRTLKTQAGFTLIELMAATAISVMFSAAFFAAFFVMRNELYQQNFFFSSNRGARFAVDMIMRDAKEAITILAQSVGGDVTDNQVLVLELPSIISDNPDDSKYGEPIDIHRDCVSVPGDCDQVTYKLDTNNPGVLVRDLVLGRDSKRNLGVNSTGKVIARNVIVLADRQEDKPFKFSKINSDNTLTEFSKVANITSLYSFNTQIEVLGKTRRSTREQTTLLDANVRLRNKSNS